MEVNFKELKFKIKLAHDNKRPDLLAYATLVLIEEDKKYFTVSGFTIRKSKYNEKPYLALPSKSAGTGFYKFFSAERSLLKEIEKVAIRQYNRESIPIIKELGGGKYKIRGEKGKLIDPKDYYSRFGQSPPPEGN